MPMDIDGHILLVFLAAHADVEDFVRTLAVLQLP